MEDCRNKNLFRRERQLVFFMIWIKFSFSLKEYALQRYHVIKKLSMKASLSKGTRDHAGLC